MQVLDVNWVAAERLPEKRGDVWQVHARKLAYDGKSPWCILIVSHGVDSRLPHRVLIWYELSEEFPTAELVEDRLFRAMVRPRRGKPCKPTAVEFCSDAYLSWLSSKLAFVGADARLATDSYTWESAFNRLRRSWSSPAALPMNQGSYSHSSDSASFDSAAQLLRDQLPFLPYVNHFEVDREVEGGRQKWFGAMPRHLFGNDPGVLLVEREGDFCPEHTTIEDLLRHCVCLSAVLRKDTIDGGPLALRHNPGGTLRAPLSWELQFLEHCMRVFPRLVAGCSDHFPSNSSPPVVIFQRPADDHEV